MSGAKAVVLDDVSFRYLDGSELAGQERASSGAGGRVCGVSLDVAYGSCTVICGRSGDGKSTVLRLIGRLVAGKTLVMIAHRLSTVVGADQIVVMDEGRVAAQGRHEELLESCPLYARMWAEHTGSVCDEDEEG